jgi:glycosyltransferase involved in cell wall biosynthesis
MCFAASFWSSIERRSRIDMRNLLMLSYYYPPLGGIGSQRSQKFARYLGDHGWHPVVVTPARGAYLIDDSLDDGRASGVEVVRTGYIDLSSNFKRMLRARTFAGESPQQDNGGEQKGSGKGAMHLLRRAVRMWVYIPDGQVGWYPFAVRAARRVMKSQEVAAIFSTSFPATAHLAAYRLKRATGKPWIADFRDLWTENHYSDYPSALRKRIDQRIEAKLLEHADVITTVSDEWAETLRRMTRGRKRVEVIRNGFADDEFASLKHRRPERWTITYVGLFYGAKQDPSPFLEALRRIIASGQAPREAVRFNIVGEPDPFVREAVARFDVADITHFTGFIPHADALAEQVNSSLLLLILHQGQANAGTVPGKLYEYLGARRPVLALVPNSFEAARLIRGSSAGVVVESQDIAGIERALVESYNAYQSNNERLNDADLSRFERRAQAGQLAALLDELVARPDAELARPRGALQQTY